MADDGNHDEPGHELRGRSYFTHRPYSKIESNLGSVKIQDMAVMSIDEVFQQIGEFGKYHWFLVGFCGYIAVTCGAFVIMIVAFITAEPEWICVKGYNDTICNFTEPITLTSKHYKARCDMPREAWTYVDDFTSAVTEFDLVCEKSLLLSIAQSCFWVGMFIGLVSGGYLADRFGRRIVLFLGAVLVAAATWVIVFPKNFIVFIVFRIIIGIGGGFRNGSSFVLLTEFTTVKHRAKIGVTSFYFWVFGLLTLALLAFLIRDWRMLLLTIAAISTPLLITWWFIPESPRWLLLHGKEKEARKCLQKVAKVNRKPYPEYEFEKQQNSDQRGSFKHLFHNLETGKRTILSWDMWFTVSLVYYGVSYGSVDLGGNRYLSFALTSFVELPSNVAAIFAANRFGRKKTVIFGLVVAFIASVVSISIPPDRDNAGYTGGRIFVAVVAKFFINLSFSGVYIWSAELFPTFIRGMGVFTSSAAARIGSFTASYIIWLIRVHSYLPFGIMGLFCLQAAILSIFIPETKGQPTMETMDDMVSSKRVITNVNAEELENKQALPDATL